MSFWQFTQFMESPPRAILPRVSTYRYADAPGKVSSRKSLKSIGSILQKLFHRHSNVAGLGEDYVLQLGLVRAEGVHGCNTSHQRIQLLKEFVRDARRNLRAIAPAHHVFVTHPDPVRFLNANPNSLP